MQTKMLEGTIRTRKATRIFKQNYDTFQIFKHYSFMTLGGHIAVKKFIIGFYQRLPLEDYKVIIIINISVKLKSLKPHVPY